MLHRAWGLIRLWGLWGFWKRFAKPSSLTGGVSVEGPVILWMEEILHNLTYIEPDAAAIFFILQHWRGQLPAATCLVYRTGRSPVPGGFIDSYPPHVFVICLCSHE